MAGNDGVNAGHYNYERLWFHPPNPGVSSLNPLLSDKNSKFFL